MPKYEKEMNRLIELEEVETMIKKTKIPSYKILIALLYITGARPSELVNLKKKDFSFEDQDMRIVLKTKKKGYERMLPFDINTTPLIKELIIPFLKKIEDPEKRIFSFRTPTRIRQIVYELSNNKLCPYNFRKNRLSRLGMDGASPHELMYFKGAKDFKSITPYLYKNPVVLDKLKKRIS